MFLSFYFGAKNGSPALGMANSLVVRRVSPGRIIVVLFWTKYAVPRHIKPGIHKLTTSRGQKGTCTLFLFFLAAKKKAFIVSFRWDTKILTADRTAGSAAVCKDRQATSKANIYFWPNWKIIKNCWSCFSLLWLIPGGFSKKKKKINRSAFIL